MKLTDDQLKVVAEALMAVLLRYDLTMGEIRQIIADLKNELDGKPPTR